MFKVWFVNFGYYSANEASTLEEAKMLCKRAGFQSTVEDSEGNTVASYCPISGWETRKWEVRAAEIETGRPYRAV